MSKQLSRLSVADLADLLGVVNSEKALLTEFESRIKSQLKKKTSERKVYGNDFTIKFSPTNKSNFNKAAFVEKYGQKTYDSFVVKSPYERTDIDAIVKTEKPKDLVSLTLEIEGFGEIVAGSTKD